MLRHETKRLRLCIDGLSPYVGVEQIRGILEGMLCPPKALRVQLNHATGKHRAWVELATDKDRDFVRSEFIRADPGLVIKEAFPRLIHSWEPIKDSSLSEGR